MRVVVIGAGISGLGAALALQDAGCSVLVVERETRVGGRMITDSEGGYTWDPGAQFMVPAYREMKRLMARLGIPMVERASGATEALVLPGNRLWYQRFDSPAAVLRHPSLSFLTKLRMARLVLATIRHSRQVGFHHVEWAAPIDTESLRQWGDRRIGADAVDYWLSVPSTGFFFWPPEETPRWLPLTFALLQTNWRVLTPAGGMGAVPEALARLLNVKLGAPAERVTPVSGGARVRVGGADLEADRVLLALPAPVALSLLHDPEAALGRERAAFLRSVTFNQTLTVAAAYRKAPESRASGVVFPAGTAGPVASLGWEQVKAPGRAPRGAGLAVINGYAPNLSAGSGPAAADGSGLLAAIRPLYPQSPLFHRTYRWEQAIARMPPGHAARLATALAAAPAPGAAIFTCGDSWSFPSTETALADGLRAAREILRSTS